MPHDQDSFVRFAAVAERSEATRAALIAAARQLFVEKGYHATGTEEIVSRAQVGTRGALYHHFPDKQTLFREVFVTVETELLESVVCAVTEGDAMERLRAGLISFLEGVAASREVQQVLLVDGPAVLGWQQWRDLEEMFSLGAIRRLLEQAVSERAIAPQPLEPLSYILLAAIDEAALYIANAPNKGVAQREAFVCMDRILSGLRE